MPNQDLDKILKKLNSIENSVKSIDNRVSVLEGKEPREEEPKVVPEKPNETRSITESEIGMKWLAWGGIAAVVVAAGFLILYAIQNNWISPSIQILIGLAIGGLLLFGGERIEKGGMIFYSRVLFGGGFPIIFYSLFAAHQFYNIIAFEITAALITAMVAGAAFIAYKKDSKTIALEGFLLGYLTPLMTWKIDLFILFYSLVLFAGMVAIMKKKPWTSLYSTGFLATTMMGVIWWIVSSFSRTFDPTYALAFLSIFFVLNLLATLFYSVRDKYFLATTTFSLITTLLFYFVMIETVRIHFLDWIWAFRAFFIAALLLFIFISRDQRMYNVYKTLAVSFVALAIGSFLEVSGVMIVTLAYAILLAKWVFKDNKEANFLIYGFSTIAFIFAAWSIFTLEAITLPEIWKSAKLITGLIIIPTFYYLWFESRYKTILSKGLQDSDSYFAGASILTLLLITLEISKIGLDASVLLTTISIIWILLAVFYIALGFYKRFKISRIVGILFFALAVLKVIAFDLAGLDLFFRIISFFVLGVILLLAAFLYKKYEKLIE